MSTKQQPQRRKAPRLFATHGYYLPVSIIERVRKASIQDGRRNASAIVTEILAREFGMDQEEKSEK